MPSLHVDLHLYRLDTGTMARPTLDSHGKQRLAAYLAAGRLVATPENVAIALWLHR